MGKGRVEAFSDGVIAILITIMVLEMKVPHGAELAALRPLLPIFLSYVLSFALVAIYWNNHHHLFQAVKHIRGSALWANVHLLFWLSLIPFVTGWMGENWTEAGRRSHWPVALYGLVMLGAGVAYYILVQTLIAHHGHESTLARAMGRDAKGKISVLIYLFAVGVAFVDARIACGLYVLVALIWLVPDRRIERALAGPQD